MNVYEGNLNGEGLRIGIVASRFNELITSKLIAGAEDCLKRHGVKDEDITLAWVPGAFEVPLMAKKLVMNMTFDAVICVGAIIRGATSHYDMVCSETAKGIAQVSLNSGIPVLFGILTTDTIEQAIERAGTKSGNKGYDTAMAAIEMANMAKELAKLD